MCINVYKFKIHQYKVDICRYIIPITEYILHPFVSAGKGCEVLVFQWTIYDLSRGTRTRCVSHPATRGFTRHNKVTVDPIQGTKVSLYHTCKKWNLLNTFSRILIENILSISQCVESCVIRTALCGWLLDIWPQMLPSWLTTTQAYTHNARNSINISD